jgi:hypothetical protein
VQASVASRPIQLHLAMFPPHVIEAVEREQARRTEVRDKRRAAYIVSQRGADAKRHALIASITTDLLDGPLIDTGLPNELDCKVDPLVAADDFAHVGDHGGHESREWSDQAMRELHESVLHYTLRVLQARGNGTEKREALMWFFAPERYTATLVIGGCPQEVLLPPQLTPFSFEMCCRICGYRSEMLTDLLQPILSKLGLEELFNEITHARTGNDSVAAQCAGPSEAEGLLDPGNVQSGQCAREGPSSRP